MVKKKPMEISTSITIARTIQPTYTQKHSLLDKEPRFYFRKTIYSLLLVSNSFMNSPVGTLGRVSTGVDC